MNSYGRTGTRHIDVQGRKGAYSVAVTTKRKPEAVKPLTIGETVPSKLVSEAVSEHFNIAVDLLKSKPQRGYERFACDIYVYLLCQYTTNQQKAVAQEVGRSQGWVSSTANGIWRKMHHDAETIRQVQGVIARIAVKRAGR